MGLQESSNGSLRVTVEVRGAADPTVPTTPPAADPPGTTTTPASAPPQSLAYTGFAVISAVLLATLLVAMGVLLVRAARSRLRPAP